MEMETTGYSIWLEPKGDVRDRLQNIIDDLAEQAGTPKFPPHITLVGGVTGMEECILRQTQDIASSWSPFEVPFMGFGIESYYFRSLYLRARGIADLLLLENLFRESFSLPDLDYMPHLSLLYSNLSNAIKSEMLISLPSDLRVSSHFIANSISLYKTEGKVEDWQKLAEYPLG